MERSKKTVFKGVINGVEYDDLGKFNKAVHNIDDHDNISISTELKTVYEDEEYEDKCICGKECKCLGDNENEKKKEYESVFNIDVDKEIEEAEKGNCKSHWDYNEMAMDTRKLVNSENAGDVVKDADKLLEKVSFNQQVLQSIDRKIKDLIDEKLKEADELCKKRSQIRDALITADNVEHFISTVREVAVNSMNSVEQNESEKKPYSKKWTSDIFDFKSPFKDVDDILRFFAW